MQCDILEVADRFDIDLWVLLGNSLETLKQIFKRGTNALDYMIAECHVVARTFIEALVIKSFFLLPVMMPLGDSVGDGSDHVSLTSVLHPLV